jgi:hypothetical protein
MIMLPHPSRPPGASYRRLLWPRRHNDRTETRNSRQLSVVVVRATKQAKMKCLDPLTFLVALKLAQSRGFVSQRLSTFLALPIALLSQHRVVNRSAYLFSYSIHSIERSVAIPKHILIMANSTHSGLDYFTRLALAGGTHQANRMNNNQAVRNHPFAGGLAPRRRRQTRRVLDPIGTPRRSNPIPPPPTRRLDHLAPEFRPGANGHVTRAMVLEQSFIAQAWHSISADAAYYLGTFFQESSFQADSGLLVQEEMARFLPLLVSLVPQYLKDYG